MSVTPFGFGPRRGSLFDPFSLDPFDDFKFFPFDARLSFLRFGFGDDPAFAAVADARVDWKETPNAHVFKADLRSLRKGDVKVEVEEEDGSVLQISGERTRQR